MIEVEIKVKISNPEEIRRKFKENNGEYKLNLKHEDTYFNMPEGLRDFKQSDEALRIRKSMEYNRENKDKKQIINYYITYKGRKLDGSTKSRKELEVKVNDGEQFKEIFKSLGFREIFTVKKERELYEFNYEDNVIEALIDYIPLLKEYFIEVEVGTDSIEDLETSTTLLFDFLSIFGINRKESIRKSYLELIAEKFMK